MKNQKLKIYKMFYLRKLWAKVLTVVIYLNIFFWLYYYNTYIYPMINALLLSSNIPGYIYNSRSMDSEQLQQQ